MRISKDTIFANGTSLKKPKTAIALLMMFAIAVSLVALPTINAQATIKTYAYIGAVPNPVGVGQETLIHVGITLALQSAEMGWEGLSITITRPDGVTETISDIRTDSTGGTGCVYVPPMAGNYTLQAHFPEQNTTTTKQARGVAVGTVALASDSEELTLVVQEEPVAIYPAHALPTEYWTRPIDSQLREWYTISASWLYTPRNYYAPYNDDAPETAHILWTTELTTGGLAGGELGLVGSGGTSVGMETGDAYEGKFGGRVYVWSAGPVIIAGKLYYTSGAFDRPKVYHCVDVHTGEELWAKTFLDNQSIAFGQLFYFQSFNYMGTFAYLWVTVGTTWYAFDAFTGNWMFTIENVPSGTTRYGANGEIYRYTFDLKNGWMAMWNMTAFGTYSGTGAYAGGSWGNCVHLKTLNAAANTTAAKIAWQNWTIPTDLPGSVQDIFVGDRVIGASITNKEVTSWGLSLEEGSEGTLLFKNTWNAPDEWSTGNLTISWAAISQGKGGVFVLFAREQRKYYGFSADTGIFLWETEEPEDYLNYYVGTEQVIAYGRLISTGVSGITYCYNLTTGELLWKYYANDPYTEILWANNWWTKPMFVTDGKIYIGHMEHSANQPLPRGAPFICLNITTGEEIWRADGLFRQTYWGARAIIGDSTIVTMDTYDLRVYAIGKGPTATTVSAPDTSIEFGESVLVKGTVTDISPGTQDTAIKLRFPNGVPAVADESMSDWMLYVYKQFEKPADVKGVEVIIEVLDPNGNSYEVARTTSDANGFYSATFTPPVPGKYTVIARFAGSKAYYGSSAETSIIVGEAPAATVEATPAPEAPVETYFAISTIAIIVAIAIVGLLLLRKR